MQIGYIRLHRCLLDNSWSRNPDFVAVWIYCLLRACYNETDFISKWGTPVHLMPGQFVASRGQISVNTGIEQSKVERILKMFKSEQQIEQQNYGRFRVITILNWAKYQATEQVSEQRMNNGRTTDEQRVNTYKEGLKKEEEGKEEVKKKAITPPRALFDLWNEIIESPKASTFSMSRETKCRVRLNERSLEEWRLVLHKIRDSRFCQGQNKNNWRADFDWIISNDSNYVKVLEGRYDNNNGVTKDTDKPKSFRERVNDAAVEGFLAGRGIND